jgi:hypothetical protein
MLEADDGGMAVEVELSLVAVRQIAAEEQQQLRDLSP